MTFLRFTTKIAIAVMLVASLSYQASGQITDITFSRTATAESGLSEIEFRFGVADDVLVQIDPLGSADALFVNNDGFGQDLGLEAAGPITSIGVVNLGDTLVSGTDFGSTTLDIDASFSPGDDFFLGFSSGTDVGYFNVAWEDVANGSIFFSAGRVASGGSSVVVVPEPTAAGLIAVAAIAFVSRRRRDA